MFLCDQGFVKFTTFGLKFDISFWDIEQQVAWVKLEASCTSVNSQVSA
jgi:hypothetical protein